jgi:uncharacterized protein YceH (UPF0502 family)
MKIELTAEEARVIGCLIEKQITTPDQYPLSLNALTNACNQKSNRDPILDLDEASVQTVLDGLARRHFVIEKSGFGSRVPKYQHRFCNTEYGTLKLTPEELAVMCELMLRGPQTAGELRTRASRMAGFVDVEQSEAVLQQLMERSDGPFVARLAREPGRREPRYMHLLSGAVPAAAAEPVTASDAASALPSPDGAASYGARLEALEREVRTLRAEVDALKSRDGGRPAD